MKEIVAFIVECIVKIFPKK